MNAKQLVDLYGTNLIGRVVRTLPMGEYPGGRATVTALCEDEAAPEIVLNVIHPNFGPCGIFDFEKIELLVQAGAAPMLAKGEKDAPG